MKILWCTDIHATGKSPNSRIDNYSNSIKEKLIEIGELSRRNNINFIVIGGDLFHIPVIANSYAGEIAKIIRDWNIKVYVVPGNHDLSGYNISTIKHSTLGIFESTGVITLLTREKPIVGRLGNKIIALEGQEYFAGIDDDSNNYNKKFLKSDYNILFAHGMLVEKPIMDSISHVVINDIPNPANVTFSGHDHSGYGIINVKDNMFINIGSIGRTDCGSSMKKHKPSVAILTIENINGKVESKIDKIELQSAKSFCDVFKETETNAYKDEFVEFVNNVRAVENSDVKQDKFLEKLKDDNVITDNIYESCKKYIDVAKLDLDSNMLKSGTKIKETIYITKIEMTNFLSHKNSVIEFDEGLNIILGENGCGKSSIFIAIQYVLFDTPKGTDFIRTGSSSCEVKICFNNNTYIRKVRTKTKGTYYVFNGDSEEKFEGYANNLPKQIADTHQMPMVNLYKEKLVSLNYADQHDGLFLMSLSSSEKAEAIGLLTGTNIIDEAINKVGSDIRELKTSAKTIGKTMDELSIKRLELSEKYEKINSMYGDINKKYEMIKKLRIIEKCYSEFLSISNTVDITKNKINDIDYLLSNVDYKANIFCKCLNAYTSYLNHIQTYNLSVNTRVLKERTDLLLERVGVVSNKLYDYSNVISSYNNIVSTSNTIAFIKNKIIDISIYEKKLIELLDIDNIFFAYKELLKTKNSIEYISNDSLKINNAIDDYVGSLMEIDIKIDFIKNQLSEIGVCPTCNHILDDESINYIVSKEMK